MQDQQIEQVVSDYIRHNLSPTKPERENISRRYAELQSILGREVFQQGSYARFTSITPVNDLDVVYVLPESVYKTIAEAAIDPARLNMASILESLANELRRRYPANVAVKVQPHSVGIYFGSEDEFSIDVVPAIPTGDGMFWVPETMHYSVRKRRELYLSAPGLKWIKSDPIGYITQAQRVDEKSEGRFRKTAKFIKKWKTGCKKMDDSFPLKSFHVELLVTELFKKDPFASCFASIEAFLQTIDRSILAPCLADRADMSQYVDQYVANLTQLERDLVARQRQAGIETIKTMKTALYEAEVIKGIERLLYFSRVDSTPVHPKPGATVSSPAYSKPWYE